MNHLDEMKKFRLICEGSDFTGKSDIDQPLNSKWILDSNKIGKTHPNNWYAHYYNENDPEFRLTTIYDRLTDNVHIITFIKMGRRKDYKFDNSIEAEEFLRNKFGISLDKGKGYIK
jgi:hypothetical protein